MRRALAAPFNGRLGRVFLSSFLSLVLFFLSSFFLPFFLSFFTSFFFPSLSSLLFLHSFLLPFFLCLFISWYFHVFSGRTFPYWKMLQSVSWSSWGVNIAAPVYVKQILMQKYTFGRLPLHLHPRIIFRVALISKLVNYNVHVFGDVYNIVCDLPQHHSSANVSIAAPPPRPFRLSILLPDI